MSVGIGEARKNIFKRRLIDGDQSEKDVFAQGNQHLFDEDYPAATQCYLQSLESSREMGNYDFDFGTLEGMTCTKLDSNSLLLYYLSHLKDLTCHESGDSEMNSSPINGLAISILNLYPKDLDSFLPRIKLLAEKSKRWEYYDLLGNLYLRVGLLKQAQWSYGNVQKTCPDSFKKNLGIIHIHHLLKETDNLLKYEEKTKNTDPVSFVFSQVKIAWDLVQQHRGNHKHFTDSMKKNIEIILNKKKDYANSKLILYTYIMQIRVPNDQISQIIEEIEKQFNKIGSEEKLELRNSIMNVKKVIRENNELKESLEEKKKKQEELILNIKKVMQGYHTLEQENKKVIEERDALKEGNKKVIEERDALKERNKKVIEECDALKEQCKKLEVGTETKKKVVHKIFEEDSFSKDEKQSNFLSQFEKLSQNIKHLAISVTKDESEEDDYLSVIQNNRKIIEERKVKMEKLEREKVIAEKKLREGNLKISQLEQQKEHYEKLFKQTLEQKQLHENRAKELQIAKCQLESDQQFGEKDFEGEVDNEVLYRKTRIQTEKILRLEDKKLSKMIEHHEEMRNEIEQVYKNSQICNKCRSYKFFSGLQQELTDCYGLVEALKDKVKAQEDRIHHIQTLKKKYKQETEAQILQLINKCQEFQKIFNKNQKINDGNAQVDEVREQNNSKVEERENLHQQPEAQLGPSQQENRKMKKLKKNAVVIEVNYESDYSVVSESPQSATSSSFVFDNKIKSTKWTDLQDLIDFFSQTLKRNHEEIQRVKEKIDHLFMLENNAQKITRPQIKMKEKESLKIFQEFQHNMAIQMSEIFGKIQLFRRKALKISEKSRIKRCKTEENQSEKDE